MNKKIVSAVLIIAAMLCFFPAVKTFAASEFTVKKDADGNSYIAGYTGKGGELTIPSSAKYIGENAFADNINITGAIIPDGCRIDAGAFENCVNLKSVTLMGDVPEIGDEAFKNCISLENIYLGNSNAEIGSINKKAFMNCFSLCNVNLPANTVSIGFFAFGNCTSLENFTIPKNTEIIEDYALGYMYDEKKEEYFKADGETKAYVTYRQIFDRKLMEWYAPQLGNALILGTVKNSGGNEYAKRNKIEYVNYSSAAAPVITAESGTDSVVLKWNKIDGADAYRVEYSSGNNFKKYKITAAKTCTVSGLESEKSYTFKVTVLKKIRSNKYFDLASSEEITVTTNKIEGKEKKSTVPEAPKVTATSDSDSISLTWKKVDYADSYRVYIFDNNKNKFVIYKNFPGKRCEVTGLKSSTEYKFKVVSLYKVKNKLVEGGSTDEIVISTSEIVKS